MQNIIATITLLLFALASDLFAARPAGAYMVVHGIGGECAAVSEQTQLRGKSGYYTAIRIANPDDWKELKIRFTPERDGLANIEIFTIPDQTRPEPSPVLFDNFAVDGKPLDNGDFENGYAFWHFGNIYKPQKFSPKILYGIGIDESACLRIFDRENLILKKVPVRANVPVEFSVWTKSCDAPDGNQDTTIDLKKFFNTDFVAATSIDGTRKTMGKLKSKIGRTDFGGVSFDIADPAKNGGLCVVSLPCKSNADIFEKKIEIDLSNKAVGGRYLYLLHTATDPDNTNDLNLGEVVVETFDGFETRPTFIQNGRNISDCWKPEYPDNCRRVYIASKKRKTGALFLTRIKLPPKRIKSVKIRCYATRFWSIFGATVSDKEAEISNAFAPDMKFWAKADIPEDLEIVENSALDLSPFLSTGTPAGKFGRVAISERGTLCFEKKPQDDIRFKSFGLNGVVDELLELDSDIPKAKELAARYAKLVRLNGYNLVRIKFDNLKKHTERDRRAARYEIIDYLFSEFKKNGVYVYLPLAWYDLGTKDYIRNRHDELKMKVMLGYPEARAAWRETALEQLEHFNKYTNLKWKDDPVILSVELYNEFCLAMDRFDKMPPLLQADVRKRWGTWLEKRYGGDIEKLRSFHKTLLMFANIKVEKFEDAGIGFRNPDWLRFIKELDDAFMDDCVKLVRGTGYKGIISQGNMVKTPAWNALRSRITDLVICNTYFAHPWKSTPVLYTEDLCPQESSFGETLSNWTTSAAMRLYDRPFAITEYNHCYWNKYRYEFGVGFPAYSAFQNFSFLTLHADAVAMGRFPHIMLPFETRCAPISRANEVLSSAFFVRGDVKPAAKKVRVKYPQKYLESDDAFKGFGIEQTRIALLTGYAAQIDSGTKPEAVRAVKTTRADLGILPVGSSSIESRAWFQRLNPDGSKGFDMAAFEKTLRQRKILPPDNITDTANGVYQTDTKQITLDTVARSCLVATDFSAAAAMEKPRKAKLGAFEINSLSCAGTLAIVSLDGKKLADSKHMLLIFSTAERNKGSKFSKSGTMRFILREEPPILLAKGEFSATLATNAGGKFAMYPLALNGQRREKIALETENGRLKLDAKNYGYENGAVVMFEIAAEN